MIPIHRLLLIVDYHIFLYLIIVCLTGGQEKIDLGTKIFINFCAEWFSNSTLLHLCHYKTNGVVFKGKKLKKCIH